MLYLSRNGFSLGPISLDFSVVGQVVHMAEI